MKTKYLLLFFLFFFSLATFVQAATVGQVESLHSSNHTEGTPSNDTVITVIWTAAGVTNSSLNGYATAWDHFSITKPVTKTLSGSATTMDSPTLSDASDWYFHIRAIADDGTYGQTSHLGPFVINTVPVITSVSPATGTTTNATDITVTGTNFVSNATVKIGSANAISVQVMSQTKITAKVPSGMSEGTYSVKVTNPDLQVATKYGAFTVAVQNTAPVADAGQDQTLNVNIQVILNGSGSSDGDADNLTYAWSQTGGTSVNLSSSTASNPTFTPNTAGTYTFQLVVNDGTENSNPDTVDIIVNSSDNHVPVASLNVTPGTSITPSTALTLDASGSSIGAGDTGQTLTYAWSIVTKPSGSTAQLSATGTESVIYTPDKAGIYKIKLAVTDSYAQPLSDDTTTIITANTTPTADAGQDQTVDVGASVALSGTGDSKDTGQSITFYTWSFTNKPSNSNATLTHADAQNTGFTADMVGTYTLKLTVNDGMENISDTVSIAVQTTISGQVTSSGSPLSGVSVSLSGAGNDSATTDSNGDYSFAVTKAGNYTIAPSKSDYSISSATVSVGNAAVVQSFTATKQSSGGGVTSDNHVPVASLNVTPGTSITPSTALTLDASGSSIGAGDTGQTLTYAWSIVTKPSGSTAQLSATGTESVIYTPDKAGIYKIKLAVTDSYAQPLSDDTTTIITANTTPTADAGQDQTVDVGASVALSGTGDSKDTGQSITFYTWSFTNKPSNSNATLTHADAQNTGFTADMVGTYTLKLTVNDGMENISDTVSIAVQTTISGQVTSSGSPLSGVSVSLSGAGNDSATTDSNGDYSFAVTKAGNYTIAPSKSDYSISSATVSVGNAAVVQSFTATKQSSGETIVTSNATIGSNATNTGNVKNIIIKTGVAIANTGGTITDVTLSSDASIDGGTVSGILIGDSDATITNALIDITSISDVTIGPGCKVTVDTITNISGLDLTGAITDIDGVIDPNAPFFIDDADNELTLGDLMIGSVNNLLMDSTTEMEIDPDGTITMSAQSLGGIVVSAKIMSVVTTSEPDGVTLSPSGELVIFKSGIATTLAPASDDLEAFESGLNNLGVSGDIQNNGVIIVECSGDKKLALRFNNFAQKTGLSARSASATAFATFTVIGDPNDLEGYYILATYPDETTQSLPPFIHDLNQFKETMKTYSFNYKIIPASGVIELLDSSGMVLWKGIPDYVMFNSPTEVTGISFENAGDLNGNGLSDLYMITKTGKQVIYTLP